MKQDKIPLTVGGVMGEKCRGGREGEPDREERVAQNNRRGSRSEVGGGFHVGRTF